MKTALWFVAIYFGLSVSYSPTEQSKQTSRRASSVGTLNGQVGAEQKNGMVVPATSAAVYVMYTSGTDGRSFTHGPETDAAAGGQYTYKLNKLLGPLSKQMKKLAKAGQADDIARLYLAAVDEALAATTEWVTEHPDKAWQMRTVMPNPEGFWSAEGLNPGSYEVVVRGAIAGHDADWEGSVDLASGKTISLPLTRSRFFRP